MKPNKAWIVTYQIKEGGKILKSLEVAPTLDAAMDDLNGRLSDDKPYDKTIKDIIILDGRQATEEELS